MTPARTERVACQTDPGIGNGIGNRIDNGIGNIVAYALLGVKSGFDGAGLLLEPGLDRKKGQWNEIG